MLPYTEIPAKGYVLRRFDESVSQSELQWHWDEEDRCVHTEQETDWQLQLDNLLPMAITNLPVLIKAGQWHRIIKGTGELILVVRKL